MLPQKPRGETLQNIDDWELSEMNSDSEMYPTYHVKKKHTNGQGVSKLIQWHSLFTRGECGILAWGDLLSDRNLACLSGMKKYMDEKSESLISEKNESHSAAKSALVRNWSQIFNTRTTVGHMGKNRGQDGLLNLDDFLPGFGSIAGKRWALLCYKTSCYFW